MVTRHIQHQGQLEQKLTQQLQSDLTSMEDPKGWSHYLQGILWDSLKVCQWRQLMKKHHLHFSGFLLESRFSLRNTERAALSPWETQTWLQINLFWAHSIWKRSHSSKDIRKKVKKNSHTQFCHRFFWFETFFQMLFQSLLPEDWISVFILRPPLDSLRN